MKTPVHELDNHGILLMYLADELPEADRAEVEQMLASDQGLRLTLESVRRDQDAAFSAIAVADELAAVPIGRQVAVRQVSRLIGAWQSRRIASRIASPVIGRNSFRWWLYPSAAAAILALGFLVWWGNRPEDSRPKLSSMHHRNYFNPPQEDYPREFSPKDRLAWLGALDMAPGTLRNGDDAVAEANVPDATIPDAGVPDPTPRDSGVHDSAPSVADPSDSASASGTATDNSLKEAQDNDRAFRILALHASPSDPLTPAGGASDPLAMILQDAEQ